MPPTHKWVMLINREKIGADEDQNMSPTQRKINCEPRRDYFMAHEDGTWSNSEFTHLQMPLSKSLPYQYKMRQKRNQNFKPHNVEKHAIQKEEQRWLKAEIPDTAHAHCLFQLKVKDKYSASLSAPPNTEECGIVINVSDHLRYIPKGICNGPLTQVQSHGSKLTSKNGLYKLGMEQFTWYLESP
ncbi:hypothetical protein O181_026870 [Austropuccinia psidii MF-1]|uniref:Uncharacterized protein n=1 Tax=Austropuccinia psidii MF-1 TaxID=1389203 RepID=A0A9Q3CQ22_9BASI|nr:hypothetical protein [Austropuccinia psidii MF-1]